MLMRKITCFIFICLLSISVMAQTKKVSVTGKKGDTKELLLGEKIGAVTFVADDSSGKTKLHIIGDEKGVPVISGYDHDLKGNKKTGGAVQAILTNAEIIKLKKVEVEPSSSKDGGEYLDVAAMVEYLKQYADITIDKDTKCTEKGCQGDNDVKEIVSSDTSPKIVVVEGSRLLLENNFKGYGVLILTGDREEVPLSFSDELKKCKSTGETLHDVLGEIKDKLEQPYFDHARGGLRLTMDDNASWVGLIISDVGIGSGKHSPVIVLGRHPEKDEKDDKDSDDGDDKDDADDDDDKNKGHSQINKPLFLLEKIILGKVYAKNEDKSKDEDKDDDEDDVSDKKDDGDKDDDDDKNDEIKDRVQIYGAVLLGGAQHGLIKMAFADILYSHQALELVDKYKFSEIPFQWEEYKEKE